MTDDKGAGDNPYFHDAFCVSSCMACRWKEGFTAGRKAERERCLRILRSHQGKCEEILLTDYLETPF